jgi:hypothetical protein
LDVAVVGLQHLVAKDSSVVELLQLQPLLLPLLEMVISVTFDLNLVVADWMMRMMQWLAADQKVLVQILK